MAFVPWGHGTWPLGAMGLLPSVPAAIVAIPCKSFQWLQVMWTNLKRGASVFHVLFCCLRAHTPVLCWVYKSNSESKITYSKCCANMANKVKIVTNSDIAEGGGCSLICAPGWRHSELGGSSNTSLTLPTLPLHLYTFPFPLCWNLAPVPARMGQGQMYCVLMATENHLSFKNVTL